MVGGGVPKNFAQDSRFSCRNFKKEVPMHKYAIQITVADDRDEHLSGIAKGSKFVGKSRYDL